MCTLINKCDMHCPSFNLIDKTCFSFRYSTLVGTIGKKFTKKRRRKHEESEEEKDDSPPSSAKRTIEQIVEKKLKDMGLDKKMKKKKRTFLKPDDA